MTPPNMYSTVQPENHVIQLKLTNGIPPSKPSYGIDSPMGLCLSSILAPLYLYASLKGKFDVWDKLLAELPADVFELPALDVGCGRGMVLLKIAKYKDDAVSAGAGKTIYPVYGVDLFIKADQSGNSPKATYNNAASLGLLDQIVLHTADFTQLPFADETMGLVTASLSIHNVAKESREKAIMEAARVLRPGGLLVVLELSGYANQYCRILKSLGWEKVGFQLAGRQVMFGAWPCQILRATKPTRTMNYCDMAT